MEGEGGDVMGSIVVVGHGDEVRVAMVRDLSKVFGGGEIVFGSVMVVTVSCCHSVPPAYALPLYTGDRVSSGVRKRSWVRIPLPSHGNHWWN